MSSGFYRRGSFISVSDARDLADEMISEELPEIHEHITHYNITDLWEACDRCHEGYSMSGYVTVDDDEDFTFYARTECLSDQGDAEVDIPDDYFDIDSDARKAIDKLREYIEIPDNIEYLDMKLIREDDNDNIIIRGYVSINSRENIKPFEAKIMDDIDLMSFNILDKDYNIEFNTDDIDSSNSVDEIDERYLL